MGVLVAPASAPACLPTGILLYEGTSRQGRRRYQHQGDVKVLLSQEPGD